ncbi:hypothetical protein METBIDRAFT_77663 [Metschnikowia bicuspidata var. bicuspidata NRRL YB-4993]|uniref:Cyclin-like domain-containing protein n=1 Tax=Metschnikowia bicuspidata var. bicuspidata NRRL YB-4993 TaxID=869754 RepID=A0A1A0HE54_9ASCO|nr:hypothetical protein METBIDRAFT_77663 [Metschnikowia bicuspidata var. bicuspidata NRRL YB-4993]OBA22182.1 hypothetical protein METBIDRAFT_77663 [Metschnikowia bicuspidata var. bicuspidata NRRL YB-4993]
MGNERAKYYDSTIYPKPRSYPYVLEALETQANMKLTKEYSKDVKQWLSVLEAQLRVNPQMIDIQPEVQWYMRPYLLDFLIELHSSFRLQPSTLFLCVNIIDRYCAKRIVFKRHYQLVGCTALWIAGKYEDKKLRVPTLRELAIMCRQAYDEEMFVQMEMHILSTLEWLLSHPLLEDCLRLAISEAGVSLNVTPCKYNRPTNCQNDAMALKVSAVTAVGRFFCELSLYDRFFLTMPSSLVAVSANLLACSMLGIPTAASYLSNLVDNIRKENSSLRGFLAGPDDENEVPSVYGPFLLGFDAHALNMIRRIAIVMMMHTVDLSEVIQRKFEELGVIPVIHNFSNRHTITMQIINEQGQSVLSDSTLNPASHSKPDAMPSTPPLASQSLIFSHQDSSAYPTPIIRTNSAAFAAYSPIPDNDLSWNLPIASKLRV